MNRKPIRQRGKNRKDPFILVISLLTVLVVLVAIGYVAHNQLKSKPQNPQIRIRYNSQMPVAVRKACEANFFMVFNSIPDKSVKDDWLKILNSPNFTIIFDRLPGTEELGVLGQRLTINDLFILSQTPVQYKWSCFVHELQHIKDFTSPNAKIRELTQVCFSEGGIRHGPELSKEELKQRYQDCMLAFWDSEYRAIMAQFEFLVKNGNIYVFDPEMNSWLDPKDLELSTLRVLKNNYYANGKGGDPRHMPFFKPFYEQKLKELGR